MGSNNQPRTFKFYRQNEAEVMKSLGMRPTSNSGSGWIEKEDGQNDYLICQLKSTDKQSIKVAQKDIEILEINARVTHKIPIFAIQFLNVGDVFLMIRPEDLKNVSEYIETGKCETANSFVGLDLSDQPDVQVVARRKIGSSSKAREEFHAEREKKYIKERKAK